MSLDHILMLFVVCIYCFAIPCKNIITTDVKLTSVKLNGLTFIPLPTPFHWILVSECFFNRYRILWGNLLEIGGSSNWERGELSAMSFPLSSWTPAEDSIQFAIANTVTHGSSRMHMRIPFVLPLNLSLPRPYFHLINRIQKECAK